MVKFLEELSPEETASAEFGLCTPYVYHFEGDPSTIRSDSGQAGSGQVFKKETIDVPGIVTKGASQKEKSVEEGQV